MQKNQIFNSWLLGHVKPGFDVRLLDGTVVAVMIAISTSAALSSTGCPKKGISDFQKQQFQICMLCFVVENNGKRF